MVWVIGGIVLVLALVVIARRRNRRAASYSEGTQGRIDDHQTQGEGNHNFDRFGGGFS
jgi:hypothetical protein